MQIYLFCMKSILYLVAAVSSPAFPHSSVFGDRAPPVIPKLLGFSTYVPFLSSYPGFLPQVFVGRKYLFM